MLAYVTLFVAAGFFGVVVAASEPDYEKGELKTERFWHNFYDIQQFSFQLQVCLINSVFSVHSLVY